MNKHWIGYGSLFSLLAFTTVGWYSNFDARMETVQYLNDCVTVLEEYGQEGLLDNGYHYSELSQCNDQVAAMVRMHNQVDKWCEVNADHVIAEVRRNYLEEQSLAFQNESVP